MGKTCGLSVTVGGARLVTTATLIFMCFADISSWLISWSWLFKNEYPVLWHYFVSSLCIEISRLSESRVKYQLEVQEWVSEVNEAKKIYVYNFKKWPNSGFLIAKWRTTIKKRTRH